jgi:hypothetical protein
MGPAAIVLGLASLAGGILGGRRKQIDPEWLKQHFGPQAVSEETLALFNSLLNSPYGQRLMSTAAEQGQQFGRDVNLQAAQAGLSGPDASSGTGIFATSAAQGAGNSFQRDVGSQFFQMALPMAQEMVNQRMQAYLRNIQGYQTPGAALWEKIGEAAGKAGAMLPEDQSSQQKSSVPYSGLPSNLRPDSPYPSWMGPNSSSGGFLNSLSGLAPARQPNVNPILGRSMMFQNGFNSVLPGRR